MNERSEPSPPAFGLRQWVKTKPPRTERVGRIREIVWHGNEGQYGYFLEIEAKRYKTRYWAHELEALPTEP